MNQIFNYGRLKRIEILTPEFINQHIASYFNNNEHEFYYDIYPLTHMEIHELVSLIRRDIDAVEREIEKSLERGGRPLTVYLINKKKSMIQCIEWSLHILSMRGRDS